MASDTDIYTLSVNLENLILTNYSPATIAVGNSLNNVITGNDNNNFLYGDAGNDTLNGGIGNDNLNGGIGNDTYIVNTITLDTILEEAYGGTDTVRATVDYTLGANLERLVLSDPAINGMGNNLNNYIRGNFSNNNLYGLDGSDDLRGRFGNDYLNGGAGNDILSGEIGNDVLTGGAGSDKFYFDAPIEGIDTITDFNGSEGDKINVYKSGFGGGLISDFIINKTSGYTLSSSQFTIGAAAEDPSDRFIYNSSTGGLFFDIDGTGAQTQVQFATLQTDLFLTSSDIYVNTFPTFDYV